MSRASRAAGRLGRTGSQAALNHRTSKRAIHSWQAFRALTRIAEELEVLITEHPDRPYDAGGEEDHARAGVTEALRRIKRLYRPSRE